MNIAPILFGFFSGAGYLGLQALFLDRLGQFCEQPRTALMVHFYLLFLTILIASYIVEARPSKTPERWLRLTGLAIVISHGIAFFALTWWKPENLSELTTVWLGGVVLTPAAVASGIAFGKFVQMVQRQSSRVLFTVLCSMAAGALIASRVKNLVVATDPALAFAFLLLTFVAILTILPAPTKEDEQPEAW